jgi:hypothetical protein
MWKYEDQEWKICNNDKKMGVDSILKSSFFFYSENVQQWYYVNIDRNTFLKLEGIELMNKSFSRFTKLGITIDFEYAKVNNQGSVVCMFMINKNQ